MASPPPPFPTADLFASSQPFTTRGGSETNLMDFVYRVHLAVDVMPMAIVEAHVTSMLARHPRCVYVAEAGSSRFVPFVPCWATPPHRVAVPVVGAFAEAGDDIHPERSEVAAHRIHPLACHIATSFLASTKGVRRVWCLAGAGGFAKTESGRAVRIVDGVLWTPVTLLKLLILWRVDILSLRLTQDAPVLPAMVEFIRSMPVVTPMRPIRVAPVAAIVRVEVAGRVTPPTIDGLTMEELEAVFPPCVREQVTGFLRGTHFPKYKERFQLWLMCSAAGVSVAAMRDLIERTLRALPRRYPGPVDGHVRSFIADYERVCADPNFENMTKRCLTRGGIEGNGACPYVEVASVSGVRAHTSSSIGYLMECDIEDLLVLRKQGKPFASGICACIQRVDSERVRGGVPLAAAPKMPQDYIHAMRGRISKGVSRITIQYAQKGT